MIKSLLSLYVWILLPAHRSTRSPSRIYSACSRRPASWARRWRGCVPSRHAQGTSDPGACATRVDHAAGSRLSNASPVVPVLRRKLKRSTMCPGRGVQSTRCNLAGATSATSIQRERSERRISVLDMTGASRRGHADHIVLEFSAGWTPSAPRSSPGNGGRLCSGPVSTGMSGATLLPRTARH